MGDIKALENSTYWEFCGVLNNYLERVESHNKQMEKMQKQIKSEGRRKK